MKKQVIAIAILSAAICLTGCTVNINDETMSAAKDIAASVLDEAEIKVNGQPVDVSVDSNGDVNVNIPKNDSNLEQSADNTNSENTDAQNTSAEETNIGILTGNWYFQEQDPQNGEIYNDAGFVTVNADGTYSFQPSNGSVPMHGTIKLEYDLYYIKHRSLLMDLSILFHTFKAVFGLKGR